MYIAILGPTHPWRGGIAHHTASLHAELVRQGHRVTLFNFRRLYLEIFFPGKSQLDDSEHAFAAPAKRIYDPLDPRSWLEVGRRLRTDRPDRVILQWWHPFFAPGYAAVATLARLAGCEVVMMCHNVEPHESTPVDRTLLRLAYALPSRFVVQSQAERERLEELIGTRRPITVAAHPRYDIFTELEASCTRAEARQRYGVEARHLLLFFGLVRPYKGVDVLLEAASTLPDDIDWELIVAGEIYGSEEDYRRQIERLDLEERVRLENRYVPNEEVPVLFRAADACVLPYRQATGSGAANVALACGVPVLMSRLPTLEHAFADEAIEWFTPEDPAALADSLRRVLCHPTEAPPVAANNAGWQPLVDALLGSS
ncbi:MAG: glycosyltransferase [Persicimonas sp.]